jgi:hypothetical protein
MKNNINLEDICNTGNSVMQIIKNTKSFVKSQYKYKRFMKYNMYQSSNNLKATISGSTTRPHSVISRATQSFAGISKFEDDTFFTKPEAKFYKTPTMRPKTASKTIFMCTDFFGPNFYEFLNIEETPIDLHIDPKFTIEQYCLRYLDKVRERKLDYDTKFKKIYNKDHETDEIHINIKSFKLILQDESVDIQGLKSIVTYLPFEVVFLFTFLTPEEIIFVLSQMVFFDEKDGRMCFSPDKIPAVLKTKFDGKKGLTINGKFKFDTNVSFKLITEKKVYIATLHCPQIGFHFMNRNFTIRKHIFLEYIIFLFNDGFINWDHIALNTFKSNKDFRFHFNKITSKSNPYKFSINKIYLTIDKRFKISDHIYSTNDISLPMVYKDKDTLKFINIFGYSVELKSVKIEKYFNWKVSLILLQLRNKINIDSWINRRTKVENGKIAFDKDWYDGMDNTVIQFICKDNEYFHERRMLFRVNDPRISVQSIQDGKIIRDTYVFPKDELNVLSTIYKLEDFIIHMQKNLAHMNNYLSEIRSIYLCLISRKGTAVNTEVV